MNVEGSKEVFIKTYEYDPQICTYVKNKTKQNKTKHYKKKKLSMSKHCEI